MRSLFRSKYIGPIIGLLILTILLPILYFTGVIGPNDAKEPDPNVDSTISAEADPSDEHRDIEVEEETIKKDIDKEIDEAQKNDPNAIPEVDPDHEHVYNSTVISPSCNRQGYTLYSCECGDTYKDDVKDKLSHDYTSRVIAPTTTSGGYTLHTCSICGDEYKDSYTDPLNDSQADSGASDPEPTNPAPSEPEATDPEPSEPEQSEQPEYSGNPEDGDLSDPDHPYNDHGDCPKCGRHLWTYWDQTGCFTFLEDSICDCGAFVKAGECHHH